MSIMQFIYKNGLKQNGRPQPCLKTVAKHTKNDGQMLMQTYTQMGLKLRHKGEHSITTIMTTHGMDYATKNRVLVRQNTPQNPHECHPK